MFDNYVVEENDTIDSIAEKFNVNSDDIMKMNDMHFKNTVSKGMNLKIPNNKQDYFTIYTVNSGDNLYQISKKYNINPTLLSALNGLNDDDYIYPNQQILIPKNGYSYYISNDGDTLDLVADKFGIGVEDLVKENNIYLMSGQLLVHKK